jgi:outer membrane protein TolC
MMRKFIFLNCFLVLFGTLSGQDLLTKADAVEVLLQNNYGIQVAKNNVLLAENNTSKKLNGYMPTVDASAGGTASLGSSTQSFSNGNEANVKNAFTWGGNASVGANYTLYNKPRDVRLEQLKEQVELADIELRQSMELNILQLFDAYYEIARLSENLGVLEQTIEVSRRRLLRAEYAYQYGQGIRLDILNAQVDIQRDSINLINLEQQINNAKRNLNFIIGRDVAATFEVDKEVSYSQTLTLENLLATARQQNSDLKITNQNLEISGYDLQIIEAEKKPTLGSNANYNFSYQNNAEEAFITQSNSRGLNLGVNLAWNIFDGGAREVRRQNTEIAIQNQQILKNQLLSQIERDITNAWLNYQNALRILQAEEAALETNRLNLERTDELFKNSQITSVEFRQAQLNLLNAATSYNTAKYDAKVLEIQLYQLSGLILDEKF